MSDLCVFCDIFWHKPWIAEGNGKLLRIEVPGGQVIELWALLMQLDCQKFTVIFLSDFAAELKYSGSGRDPGDALLHEWESPRCPVPYFSLPVQRKPMWHMACSRNTTKHSHFSLECAFGIRGCLYDSSGENPKIAQWVFLTPCPTSQQSPDSVRLLVSQSHPWRAEWQEDRDIYRLVVSSCGPESCAALWRCQIHYSHW